MSFRYMVSARTDILIKLKEEEDSAWQESFLMVYGNASVVLIVSVIVSVVAVAVVYFLPSAQTSLVSDRKKDDGDRKRTKTALNGVKQSEKVHETELEGITKNRASAVNSMLRDAKGCIFARTAEGLTPRLVQLENSDDENDEKEDKYPPTNIPHKPQPKTIKLSPFYQKKENEAKEEQLSKIFSLMKEQEEKFGNTSLGELKDQVKLYGH